MRLMRFIGVRAAPSFRMQGEPDEPRQGVFITPQSLTTFPVASGGVNILARAINALVPTLEWRWAVGVSALVIGAVLYILSTTPSDATQPHPKRWVGLLVALLNTAFLFTVNLDLLSGGVSGGDPTPTLPGPASPPEVP